MSVEAGGSVGQKKKKNKKKKKKKNQGSVKITKEK